VYTNEQNEVINDFYMYEFLDTMYRLVLS
jgi:hypothetical protein